MIVVIDNYDSFSHNLGRYFELEGESVFVVRNDKIGIEELSVLDPIAIVISPGPCTPDTAGISMEVIRQLGPSIPILGVCLGHQAIGQVYGGVTKKADTPVHGKASKISHSGGVLFNAIPQNFEVGRYHSLITDISNAEDLTVTASYEGIPMAIEHKIHPIYGVQFHPESVLTKHGQRIAKNFVTLARAHARNPSHF